MEFKTDRLLIRPWTEEDATSCYEYAKDPRVGPIAGWPIHTSVENSREIIRDILSAPETYAVCLKEDNVAIGSIGIMIGSNSELKLAEDEGEIGYWIGVPFWGNGYIPEATRCMIKHAFENLGMKKIWITYTEGNEKSKRVQEKCGFKQVDVLEDIEFPLLNDVRKKFVNCMTKEEYLKMK